MVGVAVSALVEGYDAPPWSQGRCKWRERDRLHDVRMQGDEHAAVTARIQIGELYSMGSKCASRHGLIQ
jgi:hypothetical protein